ncbi:hypothetical protein, partial [Pseudomonas sp. LY10J]|uniref:hypothetical protein n=1 Tax=Pseudomonas sp. LY10J TaxID=2787783 RepID=UPI001E4233F9
QYCLGFEKTLNLAQQSQDFPKEATHSNFFVELLVMPIIIVTISPTHKHPHELLDSFVKER